MLAAAGIIIPEGLQANGANIYGGTWFETGAEMLDGGTLNYFAVPWGVVNNPLPLAAVTVIEVVLMGAVERYRYACTTAYCTHCCCCMYLYCMLLVCAGCCCMYLYCMLHVPAYNNDIHKLAQQMPLQTHCT